MEPRVVLMPGEGAVPCPKVVVVTDASSDTPGPRLTWPCQNTFPGWCHPCYPRKPGCGTRPVCPKLPASVSLRRVLLCPRPGSHGTPGCAGASRPQSRPAGASAPTPARPGPAAPGLGAGPESAPARVGSRGVRPLPVSPCELSSLLSPIRQPGMEPRGCRGVLLGMGAHTCAPVPPESLLDDIVLTHSLFLPTERFLQQLHQQYPGGPRGATRVVGRGLRLK